MNPVKKYTLAASGLLAGSMPLPALITISGKRLFLPFYHIVTEGYAPHIRHLYPVRNTALFKKDIEYLLKHFEPVGANDLYEIITGNKNLKKNSSFFHLSFDDGLKEMHEIVAPILLEKGIPATFFINSAFVDNKGLFFRYKASLLIDFILKNEIGAGDWENLNQITGLSTNNSGALIKYLLAVNYANSDILDVISAALGISFEQWLAENKPYLTIMQIKDLSRNGFSIGAHSIDHPLFATIPFDEQCRQAKECLAQIEINFPNQLKTFAFPFTDFGVSATFFNYLLNGKPPLADLSFGSAGLKNDTCPHHLQRFPMEGTLKPADKLIKTEYLYYILKGIIGRNKINRQ